MREMIDGALERAQAVDADTLADALIASLRRYMPHRDEEAYEIDDYDMALMVSAACADLAEFGVVYLDNIELARAVWEAANMSGTRHVLHGRTGHWIVEQARGEVIE